jgi:hypothetical protein
MVLAFLLSALSAAAVLLPGENTAAPAPRLRVLVRVDPGGASQGVRIPEVVDQVREIWRPYVDIEFADAEAPRAGLGAVPPDPPHDLPGYDDELRLLITDRTRASGSADEAALGWIQFVEGRPEATITVSAAAARALMSRGTWLGHRIDELPLPFQQQFVTRALSRGAAHEIGHYLLRSSTHAPYGLMRQRMTVPEILDRGLAALRLRTSEVSVLERRALHAPASASMSAEDAMRGWGSGRTSRTRS